MDPQKMEVVTKFIVAPTTGTTGCSVDGAGRAPPATASAQAPASGGHPTNGPTHQRTGPGRGHARRTARELVPGARSAVPTTEEIKRAYKQLSVKLHPDKNAHHKEKAEGLFKQIGKAKDRLLDTEARRRHDADIQRGNRRQQREVRHCNRGAATHDPRQEGRRPGEPNTLTMQRRFTYATVDFMEAQYTSIVRAREWQLARTPMPNMTRGEVWYLICPGLTMPVVRVRIVAVGVCTPRCSCHPHGVCYTHGEWQPVVHIDGDLPGENVLVSQPGRLLPTDRLAQLIAAASRRR